MNIRSMTGYALVRRSLSEGEIALSLRSVNHRGLDLHFHLPAPIEPFEPALRERLKARLVRGHVDVRVNFDRPARAEAISLNRPLLDAYIAAHESARRDQPSATPLDLNQALRLPGMLAEAGDPSLGEDFQKSLVAILETAIDQLDAFRLREGNELGAQLLRHNVAIRGAAAHMDEIRSRALPEIEARLRRRLDEILEKGRVTGVVDPQRLAQEVAILVDRGDIGEEVERLRIHSNQVEELLQQGGEVGKRLDFLLQEMNRETNTILSKTSGVGDSGFRITELALATKSDVEKIREQALNLE